MMQIINTDLAMPTSNTHVHVDCASAVEVDVWTDKVLSIYLSIRTALPLTATGGGLICHN